MRECIAFYLASSQKLSRKKLLIDAAGGHGGVALVFRAFRRVERAIVVDMYEPQSFANLRSAWMPEDEGTSSEVRFQRGDLGRPGWLKSLLEEEAVAAEDAVLVACHACSLLSDELIRQCIACEVEFAIMPCCQGEESQRGQMMRNTGKLLDIEHGTVIDLTRLGVIDGSPGYKAMMKCIDPSITPQNRILLGLRETEQDARRRLLDRSRSLSKLARKYRHIAWSR